jgi:hypothetical protein
MPLPKKAWKKDTLMAKELKELQKESGGLKVEMVN